jgi:Nickel responsive protein SCO4226-like
MADLILERSFDEPITMDDVHAGAEEARECFELHRVAWIVSLLSLDGRKRVCRFHAPDAESVRIALQTARADISRLWSGTVHDAPGCTRADRRTANVLVERRFDAPVALGDIQALARAGAWCLEAHRVTFLRSFFSADRKRMLCMYRAPDAESVRLAQREAKMPVEDVWAFTATRPAQLAAQLRK